MSELEAIIQEQTRRDFLWRSGGGFAGLALSALLAEERCLDRQARGAAPPVSQPGPLEAKKPHFAAKAKSVICLFMYGGVSQVDTWDPKPELTKRNGQPMEQISDFAGLSRTNPLLAFVFAMLLFSLAGIPPLAGFFAKWYVFVAAIKAGLFTLAVIGVLTSVVGAFYYLTIIKVMYFDEPAGQIEPMRLELRTVLAVAGIFNIFFFVYPGPLVSVATAAAKSLF